MPVKQFTVGQLADLGVPPDRPDDVAWSEIVLVDEHVGMSKYSQERRCVFRDDDGRTWAVKYEAQVEAGDYEVGPPPDNHGWFGGTVEAVEVEQRPVIVARWEPVGDEPAVDRPARGAIDSLAAVWFQEAGAREDVARESAAAWIIEHADEVAELYDAYLDSAEGGQ
ncbi:hypothetical protein RVR_4419 [Actinacidiphila reveromycinica]|uniref:Uncharacterized protein n=1 Tax=Actinacidiphila reveromycinica TaxID=659352 RepID=A0A7U3UT40_9ACTN|nr:hypothetical protein RVR_4419 [Streptomyces sp. SN-593]